MRPSLSGAAASGAGAVLLERRERALGRRPSERRAAAAASDRTEPAPDGEVVEVAYAVAPLEAEWRRLEGSLESPNLFQSYDWCCAWARAGKAAGLRQRIRIVTVRDATGIVLLWPLAIRRVLGFRILHSLGEPATQYAGVLVSPGADAARLLALAWAKIRSWRGLHAVELLRVREGSPLSRLPALAGPHVRRSELSAPAFRGGAGPSPPSAERSARTRNALRRHWRDLEGDGPVAVEDLAGPREQAAAVEAALRFKSEWIAKNGLVSAGYAHPANARFLLNLAEAGALTVARLSVGGETAAVEIGVRRGPTYWSLVQGYGLGWAARGPGQLLTWRLLDAYCAAGTRDFDFLAPAQPHKLRWSNAEVAVTSYLVPLSRPGRALVLCLAEAKPRLKRLHGLLPGPLRRRIAPLVNRAL